MSKTPERRKVYLVDKKIQFSFLRALVVTVIILSVFFGFFLVKINDHLTETLILQYSGVKIEGESPIAAQDSNNLDMLRRMLRNRDIIFIVQIAIAILILAFLVGFYAIRFSHRIAGPVYRIKKSLQEAASGDYTVRVKLRKRDFLQDLANDFNKMMDNLNNRSG